MYYSFSTNEIKLVDLKIFIVGIFVLIFLTGFIIELKQFIVNGKILTWNTTEFPWFEKTKIKREGLIRYIVLDILVLLLLAIIQYILPVSLFYLIVLTILTIVINYGLFTLKRSYNHPEINSTNFSENQSRE